MTLLKSQQKTKFQ